MSRKAQDDDDHAMAELEEAFFAQVRAGKESIDQNLREVQGTEAILDTSLGGIDVDSVLSSVLSHADVQNSQQSSTPKQSIEPSRIDSVDADAAKISKVSDGGAESVRTAWVVSVSARDAKPVKDELRERGWLDRKVKVTKMPGPNGELCQFRLVGKEVAEKVQAAIDAQEAVFKNTRLERIEIAQPAVAEQTRTSQPSQGRRKPASGAESKGKPEWQRAVLQGGDDAAQGLEYVKLFGSARTATGPHLPVPLPAPATRAVSTVPRVRFVSKEQVRHLVGLGEPFVLTDLELGPCVELWDAEYLADKASQRHMSAGVHVCPRRTVDLAGHRLPNTPKNFEFVEMPFAEFVQRCAPDRFQGRGRLVPVLQEGERLYLRSVAEGAEAARKASHLHEVFPEIAGDVKLPAGIVYEEDAYFSSVLRIASGDTQLWTHYDTMHNILIQVTGRKHAVLWPPSEHDNLYTEGSSSRVPDIDNPDLQTFPNFSRTCSSRVEAEFGPGDALFIPALWFHHVTMHDFSVAVNVFWRDLPPTMYSKKDLYGNKDLIVAQHAVAAALKAASLLSELPQPYRGFYGNRAARALEAATNQGSTPRSETAEPGRGTDGEATTCLVTGASRGIGWEIALGLAKAGAQVVLCCRDVGRAALQAASIRGITGNQRVWVEGVDVASAISIRRLAERVQERYGSVHALVNNAVITPAEKEVTEEGLERQFAVNVLGYHRMIEALLPLLMDGAPARIINMSSQYAGKLDLDDLMFERRPYHATQAYMQAKQANRMMTWAWAEELPASKVTVNACHPGSVAGTQLADCLGLKSGSHTTRDAAASVLSLVLDERWAECTGMFVVCGVEQECPWQGDPQCRPLLDLLRSLSPPT